MINDHIARPGPGYWEFRCLVCTEYVSVHERWYRQLWDRTARWVTRIILGRS